MLMMKHSKNMLLTVFLLLLPARMHAAFAPDGVSPDDFCQTEATAMAMCVASWGQQDATAFQRCGNCLDSAETPNTCQGAMTTIEACDCNPCENAFKDYYSCQMRCDEGGDALDSTHDNCEDDAAELFDCILTQLTDLEFDICSECVELASDEQERLNTCDEVQTFLKGCDCKICNPFYLRTMQCGLKEQKGLDCNLMASSGGSSNNGSGFGRIPLIMMMSISMAIFYM